MEVFERNDSRYGYRRITLELHKNGIIINHKTVLKLMKSLNIRGKQRKNEQYRSYKGEVAGLINHTIKYLQD